MNKVLVVQFSVDSSKEHAQKCFKNICSDADFVFFNAILDNFNTINLDDFVGIVLGGSGQFYLSKGDGENTWLPKVFNLLDRVVEKNIPTMGICFGSQILALHQGGKVVCDPAMQETGTFEVELSQDAEEDPIFSQLPQKFMVHLGHKDTPSDLPPHIIPLAKSSKVPWSAFRVAGKKIWGFMFHPELDKETMRERMAMFPSYVQDGEDFDNYLSRIVKDTPETAKILSIFARLEAKG